MSMRRYIIWMLVGLALCAACAGARRRSDRRVILGARVTDFFAAGENFPGILVLAGETLSPHVDLAAGVGYEYTPEAERYGYPDYSVPILAHVRWRWGEGGGAFVPCLHTDVGITFSNYYYGDAYGNLYEAGNVNPFVALGPSLDMRIGKRFRFSADLGYRVESRYTGEYDFRGYAYISAGFFVTMERAY